MLAACLGNTRSCQQLIDHGADIDFIDNEGRTALIHAAIHNNLEIVQLLLNLGADEAHKVKSLIMNIIIETISFLLLLILIKCLANYLAQCSYIS